MDLTDLTDLTSVMPNYAEYILMIPLENTFRKNAIFFFKQKREGGWTVVKKH